MKIRHFLVLAGLLIGAQSVNATPIQWTAGNGANNHWYDYVLPTNDGNEGIGFFSAKSEAENTNLNGTGPTGYLALLTSADEEAFIFTTLLGSPTNTGSAWIGNTQTESNASSSYTTYGLFNWGNSSYSISYTANTKQPHGYLVEWDCTGDQNCSSNTIPEPGTLLLIGAGLAGLGWSRRRAS